MHVKGTGILFSGVQIYGNEESAARLWPTKSSGTLPQTFPMILMTHTFLKNVFYYYIRDAPG